MRQTSAMLDQSHYVNQLVCAVGGVLVFVAKSEWRGGDQKKMEKVEFDMPTFIRKRIKKSHLQGETNKKVVTKNAAFYEITLNLD